jgi:hypothetical protein
MQKIKNTNSRSMPLLKKLKYYMKNYKTSKKVKIKTVSYVSKESIVLKTI